MGDLAAKVGTLRKEKRLKSGYNLKIKSMRFAAGLMWRGLERKELKIAPGFGLVIWNDKANREVGESIRN